MREGTRLPPANLLRPHAAPLPRIPRTTRVIPRTTLVRRMSAPIPSTSHNACTPSPFVAN
ncbi:hypothetical protein P376_3327 [Streptomyces sp. HCCB10043]|nr:hypothetical protein P376_3327 [Streptomyces sp. HCCB10043]